MSPSLMKVSIRIYLRKTFTCHHTVSTIRENIQDSIFSSEAKSVLVSCQSSGICIASNLACLPLELFLHSIVTGFPSSFLAAPFTFMAFVVGVTQEMPKVCAIISLKTTVLDSQNVNLHQEQFVNRTNFLVMSYAGAKNSD